MSFAESKKLLKSFNKVNVIFQSSNVKKEFARTFIKIKIPKYLDIKQTEAELLCAMRPGGLVSSLQLCGTHTGCHHRSKKNVILTLALCFHMDSRELCNL